MVKNIDLAKMILRRAVEGRGSKVDHYDATLRMHQELLALNGYLGVVVEVEAPRSDGEMRLKVKLNENAQNVGFLVSQDRTHIVGIYGVGMATTSNEPLRLRLDREHGIYESVMEEDRVHAEPGGLKRMRSAGVEALSALIPKLEALEPPSARS